MCFPVSFSDCFKLPLTNVNAVQLTHSNSYKILFLYKTAPIWPKHKGSYYFISESQCNLTLDKVVPTKIQQWP